MMARHPARPMDRRSRSGPGDRAAACIALMLALLCAAGAGRDWIAGSPDPVRAGAGRLRLDPNTATVEELMLLPGLGPTIAARIVATRELARPVQAFHAVEDLARVPRIGPATIDKLRPWLRCAAGAADQAPPRNPP